MTQNVSDVLTEMLEKSRYLISEYNQDIIKEFIDVGEYGLAFDSLSYPYYTDGHKITPEIEKLVKILSDKMGRKFPPTPILE